MMRPGTMVAAMLVMLTAGATAHAKMEMGTFSARTGDRPQGVRNSVETDRIVAGRAAREAVPRTHGRGR